MLKYGLIACFSRVINPEIGDYKFNWYGWAKIGSWKMEKNWVLAFQKVAKTGNIGKKSQVAGNSMQKVNGIYRKVKQVIYTSSPNRIPNIQSLDQTVFQISC